MLGRVSLIAVTLATGLAAPAVAADGGDLALAGDDVGALDRAGKGTKVARRALPGSIPRALGRATTEGAAFAGAGRRLDTGVFVLSSSTRAGQALRAAAKGLRRTPGIGDGAWVRTRSTRRAVTASVLMRVGRAVAAVRYAGPKRLTRAGALSIAKAFATTLEARMRRALARTAWQQAMDAIRNDGTVGPATAARAFAIAYGTIPGARRPPARAGTPEDGTLAIALVARAWARLTPAQHRAIERAVGARHTGAARRIARASQADLTPDPALQAAADGYAAYFTQQMGVPAPVIDVYATMEELTTGDGTKINGDALPVDANGGWGGPMVSCRIRIPPIGQKQSANGLSGTLAHEVFHCFQFSVTDFTALAPWLLEGTATWAGIVAGATGPDKGLSYYLPYVQAPEKHLFARAYDAVGFWGWAEQAESAAGVFTRMPAILTAGGNGNAFALAAAPAPGFLDGWASATFRYPQTGGAWNQVRPYSVPFTDAKPPATVVDADTDLGSTAFTVRQYVVAEDAAKPLLRVQRLGGHLRAGTSKQDFGSVDEAWFCFGDCTCPKGQVSSAPPNRPVGRPYLSLGQTGGAAEGHGRLSYHSLDEFCGPPTTGVNVTGATAFTVAEPGYCVRPAPGVFQVQLPVTAGGTKVTQVVLEISGFTGAGEYPTGPSVATVYDFRPAPAHLWETPAGGSIVVQDPGGAVGEGAFGTVDATTAGTSPDLGTTTVSVAGRWSCRG